MESVNILGVRVDNININQAVNLVKSWLQEKGSKKYIVTTNPEFIMASQQDPEFKKVLNSADLSIPDGAGLKIASDIVNTIPGIDLMEVLCKEAADYGFTTGFLGGQNGVADKTAKCLQKKYPKLKVTFSSSGGSINNQGENVILRNDSDEGSQSEILRFAQNDKDSFFKIPPTDILFVAFGQIKQEKWIAKNLDKLPVKVAMGVGGSFDYLSGSVARAPKWMRNMSLEWLFRLILQPWRVKRQLQLLKFIFLVSFKATFCHPE